MHIIKILFKLYGYIPIACYIAFILFSINDTSYVYLKKE